MLGKTIAHYRIAEKLGEGGMGEVYRARDEHLDRDVALKLLPHPFAKQSTAVDRFIREARAASALNHPNIVTIHDAGEAKAGRFIVMEFVRGKTLRTFVGQKTPLEALLHVAEQMVEALVAAHAAGIVHRDLKPENIMVRDDGYVKVLDFGLARWEFTTRERTTIQRNTLSGAVLGTLRYMSPEQARGETARSPSDIFSLGIVLYELVTGKHPFEADSQIAVLQAICSQPPLPPSRFNPILPSILENLILRMLEKDHHLRPNAVEVERVLEGLITQSSGAISPAIARTRRRMVGRQKELAELRECFQHASQDSGLLLSIGGEPGIGKTTLVEDFLDELTASRQNCGIGRGRSSERLAGTEAHLPFLETLEDLLQVDNDGSFSRLMKQLAPNWYVQISPTTEESAATVQTTLKFASRERLKRELAAFLEAASHLRPLVLFFDDLHWADASTMDLLAYVADKFDSMRLLIVAAYRPEELLLYKHPFGPMKLDLQAHRRCRDIELGFLSREDVENYLEIEFPRHHFPLAFSKLIYSKTEGNPFFMVDVLQYLRHRKVITEDRGSWSLAESVPNIERDLPESIRGMIQRKIGLLLDVDRRLLAAASVQGYEFDSAVIARTLAMDPADVEEHLDALDHLHALVRMIREQEFPDRTLTLHYRFVHVLYQNAFYASVKPARKASWSAAVAQALLGFYKEQSADIASELAVLFEAARDFSQSADYFLRAAQNATKVFAYNEAVLLARRGLAILTALPKTPELLHRELMMQLTLGVPLLATKGYGNAEVQESYDRARQLCPELGESPRLFPALWGLATFYTARMELRTARELGEQLLRLAESSQDRTLLLGAHLSLGAAKYFSGEFRTALEHFEQYRSLDDPQHRLAMTLRYGLEPGILLRGFEARTLWFLGYPDRCLIQLQETLALARTLSDPPTLAFLISMVALAHQMRGEVEQSLKMATEMIDYSTQHELTLWVAEGGWLAGWAQAKRGNIENGVEQMQRSLADYGATGTVYPYFQGQLAEILGKAGRAEEGFKVLSEVTHFPYPTYWDADLKRVEGDLLLMTALTKGGKAPRSRIADAESRLQQARCLARGQSAKSLELRSAISLSKLWQIQGKTEEARHMLSETYSWFSEGFDTADLKQAQTQLEQLS